MERDYGKEIDELKKAFAELAMPMLPPEKIAPPMEPTDGYEYKRVHPMKNMSPDPRLSSIMSTLCEFADREERTGSVTYLGVFTSGGRQSNWIQNGINTDDLLALIENRSASTVLQSIGNNDRLSLLLAILRTPMSVAAMVEKCGFNTTGQVYHHLRPLIAADLVYEVEQGERGVYAVKPHRVQGIIMLLAGIADMTDTKFSNGTWTDTETDEQEA